MKNSVSTTRAGTMLEVSIKHYTQEITGFSDEIKGTFSQNSLGDFHFKLLFRRKLKCDNTFLFLKSS
jgi:hypothetical protein